MHTSVRIVVLAFSLGVAAPVVADPSSPHAIGDDPHATRFEREVTVTPAPVALAESARVPSLLLPRAYDAVLEEADLSATLFARFERDVPALAQSHISLLQTARVASTRMRLTASPTLMIGIDTKF